MSFDVRRGAMVLFVAATVAAACAPPEDPNIGGNILNQKPPPPTSDIGAGTTTGGDGGTTTAGVACTPDKYVDPTGAACAVKWSADVFPKLAAAGVWKCTTPGCHQPPNNSEPLIPTDAKGAWDALRQWKGKKLTSVYVNPCSKDSSPTASAIYANISGGMLPVMPIGAAAVAADLTPLKTWVECGAPDN